MNRVRGHGLDVIAVFVLPPSSEILDQRLRGRSRSYDTEAQIGRRLEVAREEVAACSEYDYVVVNDEFDACVDRLRSIVFAERARLRAARPTTDKILETFKKGTTR